MRYLIFVLLSLIYKLTFGQIIPVYDNNFDDTSQLSGWNHYAVSGIDDWQVGVPSAYNFNYAYSSPNSWVTNLTGNSGIGEKVLETPFFDFTDTSIERNLNFYQKRHTSSNADRFYLEYTTGVNNSWLLLDDNSADKKNWQSSNGFTGSHTYDFKSSAISLDFLQGLDSIKFRFRHISFLGIKEGWLIDNFRIDEDYYNLEAPQGDTIRGINKFTESVEVTFDYLFYNQFTNYYQFTTNFYFSTDTIIDSSDSLLLSHAMSISSSVTNWNNTLSLPVIQNSGIYYILYQLDANNILLERDESDNKSFAVVLVDSIYQTPFNDDFENGGSKWNSGSTYNNSRWSLGVPEAWHLETSRSGINSWYSSDLKPGGYNLESPAIDLSGSANNVICFWFKSSDFIAAGHNISTSNPIQNSSYFPQYTSSVSIPPNRLYNWDCFCNDISHLDSEPIAKIKLGSIGYTATNGLRQLAIDDLYIGSALPDVAIEGERKLRYTSNQTTIDTLNYYCFNSGLATLPSTETKFYWSTDSILDPFDTFLGSNQESSILDTSFLATTFNYTKPTLIEGTYFIIYEADANSTVTEMREYDNIGYFKITQTQKGTLPYYNDFETHIDGWNHSSTRGQDDWEWGVPQGVEYDTAFSGTKAFVTNLNGFSSEISRSHLCSPIFDLTELSNPVLEFDILYKPHLAIEANVMYSIDGGNTWTTLDTSNISFKRMYYPLEMNYVTGNDVYINNWGSPTRGTLYGKTNNRFLEYRSYQGRDYDNVYHNSLDLSHLKQFTNIQFMFVVANTGAMNEGLMLDNFAIREAFSDLMVTKIKKLMVSQSDAKLRQDFRIKNNGNGVAEASQLEVFYSTDSLLSVNDISAGVYTTPLLRPYLNFEFHLDIPTPTNYINYNYLIFNLDANNDVVELNEINNIQPFELNMDTASAYQYPILFDFNDSVINGWTWYTDSLTSYHGHRFRHRTIAGEPGNFVENGEWFLDPIDKLGYFSGYSSHSTFYLESPPFDFTNKNNIKLQFDFLCIGTSSTTSNYEGASFQYSNNGGQTWQVVQIHNDPFTQNWFDNQSINSLGGLPGWSGIWGWTIAKNNLSFLANEQSVRFRFAYRGANLLNSGSEQGFRLDNFIIDAVNSSIVTLSPITICPNSTVSIFGNNQWSAGFFRDTLQDMNGVDSILVQELIVQTPYSNTNSVTICEGENYLWNVSGNTFTSDTSVTKVFTNSLGCDSTHILNLTVNEIDPSVGLSGIVLNANYISDTYQWLDCSNGYTVIPGENSYTFQPNYNGDFALLATLAGCSDTSACYAIYDVSTNSNLSFNPAVIIPNPNDGHFIIDFESFEKNVEIKLFDLSGKLILQEDHFNLNKIESNIQLPNGIYNIVITTSNQVLNFKLVLQN